MNTQTHAQEQAAAQYSTIVDMLAAVECDYDRLRELQDTESDVLTQEEVEELIDLEKDAGENQSREDAIQAIQEHPLSIEVRSSWTNPGEEMTPGEFQILLCIGGPAVRIMGELQDGEPVRAWLEYQDWGTPWTQYFDASSDTLCRYASFFFFGE